MRELTLVIPGLQWPAESVAEVSGDLALPALSALLAGEGVTRRPAQAIEHLLATTWGIAPDAAPYAALRRAGSGLDCGDAPWMCADPAHLRFARESLVLTDERELAVSDDEAAQLVAALNATFPDLGEFSVGAAGEWYLRPQAAPDITTHPVSQVLGRNVEIWLPAGAQARTWRRAINEIQMLLHGHAVNAAREAAGRATINTLWLWGQGKLSAPLPKTFDAVYANAALARGFAAASGGLAQALPPHLGAPTHERTLMLIDQLDYAALTGNAPAWRAAMMEVEADWLAPALRALKAGALDRLHLLLPGDHACLEIACAKPAWWKFWQRGVLLEDFVRRHATP